MNNSLLENCKLCPRNCGVNRLKGEVGFCGAGEKVKVARSALHFWEEPCISGTNGSGTVFFSYCSLKCVFCQNYKISHKNTGEEISIECLAEKFLDLQNQGAHNINLVTPTHFTLQIIDALNIAKSKGLNIPIVYNCSGYESIETLKLLEGYIDIYLPDFKYYDDNIAEKYSCVKEYHKICEQSLKEMFKQVGKFCVNHNNIMTNGMIVRHLILPGYINDSKKIIKNIYETYGDDIYISIMNQYTPIDIPEKFSELNRTLLEKEYDEVIEYALELGISNAFIQEAGTAKESFIPDFQV